MTRPRRPGGWALGAVILAGIGSFGVSGGAASFLAVLAAIGIFAPAPPLPPWAWVWAHGAVLLVTGLLASAGPPTLAFGLLVAWLLVHRAWTGAHADDVRVALLLATLLLLLGSVGTESAAIAPFFAVYAGLLPVALLRAELQDAGEGAPRRLEALVAVGAVGLAGILFPVLPRPNGGYIGAGRAGGGRFPTGVSLGEEGLVNDDAVEVMRVRVTDADGRAVGGPFYLRGRALDRFDGESWTGTVPGVGLRGDQWDLRARITADGLSDDVLFGLPDVVRMEGISAQRERGGAFHATQPARSRTYDALSRRVELADVDDGGKAAWLQLPAKLDPRVRTLAWTVDPDEGDPVVVAHALSDWLATTYTYVENPPTPDGDPLAWFLLDSRQGHCEYFASALAVMLRVRGIPARLATGFYSGELGEDGAVIVRRGNAHAWVEILTAHGWATLDPTPTTSLPAVQAGSLRAQLDALLGAWYRDVVEYDMNAQFVAYGAVGRRVLLSGDAGGSPVRAGLVGMVVVVGGLFGALGVGRAVLGRIGTPPSRGADDTLARLCADARRRVRSRGWSLPDELPPQDAAAWLRERVGDAAAPLERLAVLTYEARYGGAAPSIDEARRCVRALGRVPRAKA